MPNSKYISKDFFNKKTVFMKSIVAFGLFSGDKSDYIDLWMIKITIETNQIDMDVCYFQKKVTHKNHVCR